MLNKPAASFWMNAMFYTLLQRVSLFAFGVISYMILVRGFSTRTNGVWALYITIFSIFEAVKQGLLRNSTIKFLGMNQYAGKDDEVQSSSILINTIFSLLSILFVIVTNTMIAGWLQAEALSDLLTGSIMLMVLLIPFNHCEILMQATLRFDVLFKSAFIRQGTFFLGIVVMYFFLDEGFTLFSVLLLQVIALAAALVYIWGKSKIEMISRFIFDKQLTLELFHFGKYTFGTNLFAGVSRSFDHFTTAGILDPIQGKNYVAYYNTVARINNMVDVPSLAAADVLYPKNVEALEREGLEKVKYYFEQVIGTILAIIVPVSLVIFFIPGTVIDFIAGPHYAPAITILQLTILFSMVRPISYQFGSTLDAIGRPEINFMANGALLFINLLLNLVFIKVYGGIGAAYATMIYYSLSLIVMLMILKKYINIDFINIFNYAIKRYKDIFTRKEVAEQD